MDLALDCWQPILPESKFFEGTLYVLIAPGLPAFLARWERDIGLVDYPDRQGVWDLDALFYFPLPDVPPDVFETLVTRSAVEWNKKPIHPLTSK